MDFCEYCEGDGLCPAVGPDLSEGVENSGYNCTRPKGHDGPHVACAFGDMHKLAVWEDGALEYSYDVIRDEPERASAIAP